MTVADLIAVLKTMPQESIVKMERPSHQRYDVGAISEDDACGDINDDSYVVIKLKPVLE